LWSSTSSDACALAKETSGCTCSHLREHTRLGARASRSRRVYEGKMPSLPGEM
jgi:hypothetical protein